MNKRYCYLKICLLSDSLVQFRGIVYDAAACNSEFEKFSKLQLFPNSCQVSMTMTFIKTKYNIGNNLNSKLHK